MNSTPKLEIQSDSSLSPRDREVLGLLCSLADKEGVCDSPLGEVAALLGVSRTTISRSIKRLMKTGWLKRFGGTTRDGAQCAFSYRVVERSGK
ncbi:Helix-turn-helix domain-containing protein [Pseudovibrio denitrificans]|uniref:Helix-turn-helix domain-containing protein n=1 Tax=Pseudovibrio denitrificans TaxID=258256 RepID=A0A1I6Y0U8_9HYPH|nr:Helix-turn-helix domain-containing protein [Pseudovibrio denitrificans]